MWPKRYARDFERAWARIRATRSEIVKTPWGDIEYGTEGTGRPVLMSHGIFGGHVEALAMTRTYYGEDAFAIAPSRFGYFGSDLPHDATPALQADAYARLLDHLGVERVVAIGFSAGGPSAIELALRHPHRVELLVPRSSALPREPIPHMITVIVPPLMRALLGDRVMWRFKTLMPGTFRHLLGAPKSFTPSQAELSTIREIGDSMLPVAPRRPGIVFDALIGNPHVNSCALEEIAVPTLLVHANDDSLAPYSTAVAAAARMPAARFITLHGGHEFLGCEQEVRLAISRYLRTIQRPETVGV